MGKRKQLDEERPVQKKVKRQNSEEQETNPFFIPEIPKIPDLECQKLIAESSTKKDSEKKTSINFYFLDIKFLGSTLWVFGKTEKNKSICFRFPEVKRELFFLINREKDATDEEILSNSKEMTTKLLVGLAGIKKTETIQIDTCEIVEKNFVFPESSEKSERLMNYVGPKKRFVRIKYKIEQCSHHLPSIENIPPEYSDQFEEVFEIGVQDSQVEKEFLINNFIFDPWLNIESQTMAEPAEKYSFCDEEYIVAGPYKIKRSNTKQMDAPPMDLMLVRIKHLEEKVGKESANQRRIIGIHTILLKNFRMEENLTIEEFLKKYPNSISQTHFFTPSEKIEDKDAEKKLLKDFLQHVRAINPDIILSHNLHDALVLLLRRCAAHKIADWSFIGRLRLTLNPYDPKVKGMKKNFVSVAGRIICDTFISSQEFLKEKLYGLKEISASQLGITEDFIVENSRNGILPLLSSESTEEEEKDEEEEEEEMEKNKKEVDVVEIPLPFINRVMKELVCCHNLAQKCCFLQITRELTSVAGNIWNETLLSKRASRIEMLLSHNFFQNGFMLPKSKDFANEKKAYGQKKKIVKTGEKEVTNETAIQPTDGEHEDTASASAAPSNPTKSHAGFKGGFVIEPKRGFYDTYIALLDFNSLYPSIIIEDNLCYTTHYKLGTVSNAAEVQKDLSPQIPFIIKSLIERRGKVKKEIENAKEALTKFQLKNLELALKITANSIYGTFGFTLSRYYCPEIASKITERGRNILEETRKFIDEKTDGYQVVYGDTDSVMVNTNTKSIEDAYKAAQQLAGQINKVRKNIQIKIDGMFKKLILFNKKHYAALVETPIEIREKDPANPSQFITKIVAKEEKPKMEKKGIDLVKRNWAAISHECGQYILDQLLNVNKESKENEEIKEDIRVFLSQKKEEIVEVSKNSELLFKNIQKYELSNEYNPAKNYAGNGAQFPHVVVAKRKGITRVERVPYLICKLVPKESQNSSPTLTSLAEKAFHPEEVLHQDFTVKIIPKSTSQDSTSEAEEYTSDTHMLTIDADWYLQNQILNPSMRLLEFIKEIQKQEVSDWLGLAKSRSYMDSDGENGDFSYSSLLGADSSNYDPSNSALRKRGLFNSDKITNEKIVSEELKKEFFAKAAFGSTICCKQCNKTLIMDMNKKFLHLLAKEGGGVDQLMKDSSNDSNNENNSKKIKFLNCEHCDHPISEAQIKGFCRKIFEEISKQKYSKGKSVRDAYFSLEYLEHCFDIESIRRTVAQCLQDHAREEIEKEKNENPNEKNEQEVKEVKDISIIMEDLKDKLEERIPREQVNLLKEIHDYAHSFTLRSKFKTVHSFNQLFKQLLIKKCSK